MLGSVCTGSASASVLTGFASEHRHSNTCHPRQHFRLTSCAELCCQEAEPLMSRASGSTGGYVIPLGEDSEALPEQHILQVANVYGLNTCRSQLCD